MARNSDAEYDGNFVHMARAAINRSQALAKDAFLFMSPPKSSLLDSLSSANVLTKHRAEDELKRSNNYTFRPFNSRVAISDHIET